MVGKSSVSCLQEFCDRNRISRPTYNTITSHRDGGFICEIKLKNPDMIEHGIGRSKRDAKHTAASNVIKKLRVTYPRLDEIQHVEHDDIIPPQDMIMALRDYCVKKNHPLPVFDIVQQAGTADAPEFTAVCKLATLRRYGVSEKKKDARQKAAFDMLRAITTDENGHSELVVPLETKAEDIEAIRYMKFKTYRELSEAKAEPEKERAVLLCDRHFYFQNFYDDLKKAAIATINDKTYETAEAQVMEIARNLKITPTITEYPAEKGLEPLLLIEYDTDYDVVFINYKSKIYEEMLSYFKAMLLH